MQYILPHNFQLILNLLNLILPKFKIFKFINFEILPLYLQFISII